MTHGDFVQITQGLEASQRVVSAGGFKLHNNTRVVVDEKQSPKASLQPRPENM